MALLESRIPVKLRNLYSSHRPLVQIAVIVVVALTGYITLQTTHAATYVSSAEAESGTLSGGASIISDSAASGSSAVQMGSSAGGTTSGCTANGVTAPCSNGSASGSGSSGYGAPEFDDEFNGTSLDTVNWIPGRRDGQGGTCTSNCAGYNPPANGGNEIETFNDATQLTESGGSLNLTATQSGSSWKSAAVEMVNGENYTYGYFEARIKVPDPTQAWTAFWLSSGENNTWPPELDIFEFAENGNQPTFNNHGQLNANNYNGYNLDGWPDNEHYGSASTDFTQWHTYGMLWSQSGIKLYLDGKLQNIETSNAQTGIPSTPMYPIFDYAISQGATPTSGSTMSVDYFRVWKSPS